MTQRVVNYTYGTGNPVLPNGSIDVRDGIDNLQSFDVFMNAYEDNYNQRNGNVVKTLSGAVRSIGIQRIGDFTTGCTVTERNQGVLYESGNTVYVWMGILPKVVPSGSSPSTTGGISSSAWVDVGDASAYTRITDELNRLTVDNVSMLSVVTPDDVGKKVSWLGYYEVSDGGGNWGIVKSGSHVADGGSIFSISPTLYIEANLKGKSVNVRKFGARAVANGTLYDCITQIRACEAYVRKDPDPNLQQTMYFPCGKYGISDTWHVDDTMDFTVYFDNVYFVSMATTTKDAMILCTDWVQSQILGAVRFDNTRNPLYANFYCGLSVQPLTKGSTKNGFYNVKSLWFPCGLKVGEDTNDLACSEQTFFNYSQFECLRAFEGAGLQSGATFVGCNLLATPSPELTGPIHAMWLKGGFWIVVGGEVLTTQSASYQCIRMNPCKGANPTYPQLRINGAIVETASPLVLIDNPEGVVLDRSQQPGQLQIQGSGGYCGGDAIKNSTFIDAADDYYGVIQIKNNNFYAAVQRNAFNINAGPVARIDVDETSFGVGFKDRVGGVNGGILIHDNLLVASAYGATGAVYSAGVQQTLKFSAKSAQPRCQRYNAFYDLTTGVYTVPQGGHKSMIVEANIVGAGLNGDLFVEVDGVNFAFGKMHGSSGSVIASIDGLAGGQTVSVFLRVASGSVTLTNGRFTNISFTVSN